MGVSHFFSKLCGTCCGGMHLARPLSHSTTNGSIAQDAPRTASMTPCWPTASAKPSPTCWASSKTYLHHHPLHAPPHTDLLQRAETDFFSGEPLRALSTLVYSDNIDLQRSASLTFAEITERGTCTCALRLSTVSDHHCLQMCEKSIATRWSPSSSSSRTPISKSSELPAPPWAIWR